MENTISLFSNMNTENDALPCDQAKDLYQIIDALSDKIAGYNTSTEELINVLKKHIADHSNPHHLRSINDVLNSLVNTIYLYYAAYYNRDDDVTNYSQDALSYLLYTDPIVVAELLRRIQLNSLKWVDGAVSANNSHQLLKNYYTNDVDIDVTAKMFTPVYSSTRDSAVREFPYISELSDYKGDDSLSLSTLKDYYLYDGSDVLYQNDFAYGIRFGNKPMLTEDMFYFHWDESYILDDQPNGISSLVITPHNTALLISPSFVNGQYLITVKVGAVNDDDFTINFKATFTYRSDRPSCALSFSNSILGYISVIRDNLTSIEPISYPFTYVGRYDYGKCFSSVIIDESILPISVIDPTHSGTYSQGFTPPSDLVGKMISLELSRATIPSGTTGYIPDIRYIAERFSQL